LQYRFGPLGGIAAFSGVFATNLDWKKVDVDEKAITPILLHHGGEDPIINPDYAEVSYQELEEHGVSHF
jgi:predicted esterase